MKNIPNRTFEATPEPTTTAKLLSACLDFAPDRGFDFATIRARQRVQDVIDKVTDGGELVLEDADYNTAREAITATRWIRPDKHLIDFAVQFGL